MLKCHGVIEKGGRLQCSDYEVKKSQVRQIEIGKNEAGQRLDKLLAKYLNKANKSFIYKMLRKKNITLNDKKAQGSEILCSGDIVTLFLSDETIDKFSVIVVKRNLPEPKYIYEDGDIALIDKPAGMLTQRDGSECCSLNDIFVNDLLERGIISDSDMHTFRPSVVNRLDRNTSGIVAAGKTLCGLQALSEIFRSRLVDKDYLCLVSGLIESSGRFKGYIKRDKRSMTSEVTDQKTHGAQYTELSYRRIARCGDLSFIRIRLHTGRTHQIRVQMADAGYPLIGDPKYGILKTNLRFKSSYGLDRQFLHAAYMTFGQLDGVLSRLSGRSFYSPLPKQLKKILEQERLRPYD